MGTAIKNQGAFTMLERFISHATNGHVEPVRLGRAAITIFFASLALESHLLVQSSTFLKNTQLRDGGWSDPEETAWALAFLSKLGAEENKVVQKGVQWLHSVRHPGGGWGRHPRDQVRIPTTALVITLVPSVATQADKEWVKRAWERDLASPVRLSYKGGFYLLTADSGDRGQPDALVSRTISYLADDQNEDGGFGPWRNHPIGSDPWSTGVVLWGLSKWVDIVDSSVIQNALGWLEKTQLPSGYWAYHYLDEGTSYALIGATAAMRALENRGRNV